MGQKSTAWMGIDSLNGRYLFGSDEKAPDDGRVKPKQTAMITARSYRPFRAERFFVQRACARDFLIRGVFVGNRIAILTTQDPIIAEPFAVDFDDLLMLQLKDDAAGKGPINIIIDRLSSDLHGLPFRLPLLSPGIDLTFQVENIGTEPSRFLAALYGEALWE